LPVSSRAGLINPIFGPALCKLKTSSLALVDREALGGGVCVGDGGIEFAGGGEEHGCFHGEEPGAAARLALGAWNTLFIDSMKPSV